MFGSLMARMFGSDADIARFEGQQKRLEMRAPAIAQRPVCPSTRNLSENRQHKHTRVYLKTKKLAHCLCNDCGMTWKAKVDPADDWAGYLGVLADSLEAAATKSGDVVKVTFDADDFASVVSKLREIARSDQ